MKAGQNIVSASLEDYLEAIFHIEASKGAARAKDIALAMDVKNASVTQALRSLSEKDLVNYAPYEVITLTQSGHQIALDVVHRHEILEKFLSQVLGLEKLEADEGACRMEHSVSRPILNRLIKFMEHFQTCPLSDIRWDDDEGFFCGGQEPADPRRENCGRDVCGHKALKFNAPSTGETEE